MKRIIFLLILLLSLTFAVHVFAAYPNYKGYVNDFANVIKSQEEQKLNQKLSEEDKKTSNQIAVVTVNSTQPEAIEDYSIHLAEQWKPGQKGKDNGVIMLFAMKDRQMRIEVGRGLEDDLTDIESKHILDDVIKPEFRAGRIESGVDKGVDAVILAIHTADEVTSVPLSSRNNNGILIVILLISGALVVVAIIAHSKHTPLGGEGDNNIRGIWVPKRGSKWGEKSIGKIEKETFIPIIPPVLTGITSPSSNDNDDYSSSSNDSSNSGWSGINFGGGIFSGGGATSSW